MDTTTPESELIVLLDENHNPIGSAPKLASHHANTPLHLAFSCYVFNRRGELLITQRAHVKKVWPGVWTNSFCGHPAPGESMEDAIARRGDYEIGLTKLQNLTPIITEYQYKTPPYNGIVEHEFCPIFACITEQEPVINPDEVDNYRWITTQDLTREISLSPADYSYWFKEQLTLLPDGLFERL